MFHFYINLLIIINFLFNCYRPPFGIYLRNETKLSDWVFEVLEELPSFMNDSDILKKESEYIIKYDSIKNGFNTVISNKSTLIQNKIENE